jgi:small subunit ribosomal protein S17
MSEKTKVTRNLQGSVVSTKMDKTVVVVVVRKIKHPLYGKYVKRSKKIFAHDSENSCHEGDVVIITECRPISRNKRWRLLEIVKKAERTV